MSAEIYRITLEPSALKVNETYKVYVLVYSTVPYPDSTILTVTLVITLNGAEIARKTIQVWPYWMTGGYDSYTFTFTAPSKGGSYNVCASFV